MGDSMSLPQGMGLRLRGPPARGGMMRGERLSLMTQTTTTGRPARCLAAFGTCKRCKAKPLCVPVQKLAAGQACTCCASSSQM